ncbi:SlyX family protein [Fulvimarina sp. 2208YS6-2-32]|uniref:SlyX family protein n=1 Tax=Fulvimarina uroteuthidis TaxID=3098149 RepID=A0ABU5I010_9HYPH|nr:SlyX family protein [Fulvimarina sp. 2208YS6-2-32]MDY8108462.1 SlyX family protein [Fulvimarina sp. 2208YS6-2-32]
MAETDSSVESRLEDLEVLSSHQAKTLEELSEELTKAFSTIRHLQLKVEHLTERVGSVEAGGGRPEATKPPHY